MSSFLLQESASWPPSWNTRPGGGSLPERPWGRPTSPPSGPPSRTFKTVSLSCFLKGQCHEICQRKISKGSALSQIMVLTSCYIFSRRRYIEVPVLSDLWRMVNFCTPVAEFIAPVRELKPDLKLALTPMQELCIWLLYLLRISIQWGPDLL